MKNFSTSTNQVKKSASISGLPEVSQLSLDPRVAAKLAAGYAYTRQRAAWLRAEAARKAAA